MELSGKWSAVALKPIITEVIDTTYRDYPSTYPTIFNVKPTTFAYDDDLKIAGFPMATQINEGDRVVYQDMLNINTVRYTSVMMVQAFRVSEQMMDDQKVNIIREPMRRLAHSLIVAKEQRHANIFNLGFAANPAFTAGDGVPLFNLVHPLGMGGLTASNRLAVDSDIGIASVQEALALCRYSVDDRNHVQKFTPRFLVVSPSDEFTANEIVRSQLKPGFVTNDKNVLQDLYNLQVVVWPELTDTDAWFVVADKPQQYLKSYQRRDPRPDQGEDFDTFSLKFKYSERYICGFSDWRGCVGTPGA
jgi:hypothetical protein